MFEGIKVRWLMGRLAKVDSYKKSDVVEYIGRIHHKSAFKCLVGLLENAENDVRCVAAKALGGWGDQVAVAPLLSAAEKSNVGPELKRELKKAFGDRPEVDQVFETLVANAFTFRLATAEALGNLKDAHGIQILASLLTASDEYRCKTVIATLGRVKQPEVIPILASVLSQPKSDLRRAAVEAIGQFHEQEVVTILIGCLRDSDVTVRRLSATALGETGNKTAVGPLIGALCDHEGFREDNVALAAAAALAKLGEPRWKNCLGEDSLQNMERLGATKDERLLEPLVNALRGSYLGISTAAAKALGMLGDARAIPALNEILAKSDCAPLVAAAGDSVKRLGGTISIDVQKYLEMLTGKERTTAAKVLSAAGDTRWERLVKGDEGDFARLGRTGDARLFKGLLDAFKGEVEHTGKGYFAIRKAVAAGLVEYAAACATAFPKELIEYRSAIARQHTDSHTDYDTGAQSDCTHVYKHADNGGIGLAFPNDKAIQQNPNPQSSAAVPPVQGGVASPEQRDDAFLMKCPNPSCAKEIRVPREYAGQEGECPHCGKALSIPAQTAMEEGQSSDF